jgi:hypothetical protein
VVWGWDYKVYVVPWAGEAVSVEPDGWDANLDETAAATAAQQ